VEFCFSPVHSITAFVAATWTKEFHWLTKNQYANAPGAVSFRLLNFEVVAAPWPAENGCANKPVLETKGAADEKESREVGA
jgi:hypothetical protein